MTVQVYTKPVDWTRNVHGRNITKARMCELCAKCVQTVTVQVYTNQFTVQVYTNLVYWLIMKGMYMDRTSRNVHGRNITKVRLCELCAKCVQTVTVQAYTKPVHCTSVYKTVCKLVGISLNKLKVDIWKMKGEIQFWGQTDTQTHTLPFALLELLLRS